MYKQCRTEQSANRQRELEQGLLEVMTQVHYDQITVSDLCVRMGIPRKSFYRYFSSKEGALHALIDHALLDFEGFPTPDGSLAADMGLRGMERLFSYWQKHCKLLDALEHSTLSGVLIERSIAHALEESIFPNRYLTEEELLLQRHITSFAVTGLMSMVVQWHHAGYAQSPLQMAQIALRLVSKPLFPQITP